MENASLAKWTRSLRDFAAIVLAADPLRALAGRCAILLHGSTTFGVDDDRSDLDLWVIAPSDTLPAYDALAPSRFLEFKLDGKQGHSSILPLEPFTEKIRQCHFPLIAELRSAVVIADTADIAGPLLSEANRPMRPEVQKAWFINHYVEMRAEYRACESPIERGDPTAVLIPFAKTIEQALRAACILDAQPYQYTKWLSQMARRGPTGAKVAGLIDQAIELIGKGALRIAKPLQEHPLNLKLEEVRAVLVESATSQGLNGPWLTEWWHFIEKAPRDAAELRW